jgi:hypothetical protein
MRLMLETLRDEDVRRLQRRLRRAVAKKKLYFQMKSLYKLMYGKKRTVNGRLLFLRIFQLLGDQSYHVDACDLTRARNRKPAERGRYYAEMTLDTYFMQMTLKHPNPQLMYDFGFGTRILTRTHKIQMIQRAIHSAVCRRHNRIEIAFEQTLLLQRKFTFKGTALLLMLFRMTESNKLLSYFCSTTRRRK